jgi:hypothetical protein
LFSRISEVEFPQILLFAFSSLSTHVPDSCFCSSGMPDDLAATCDLVLFDLAVGLGLEAGILGLD